MGINEGLAQTHPLYPAATLSVRSDFVTTRSIARSDSVAIHEEVPMTHVWFWRSRLPERKGQHCRVLARGTMNSALVEFEDGYRVITSRWAVRALKNNPAPACIG